MRRWSIRPIATIAASASSGIPISDTSGSTTQRSDSPAGNLWFNTSAFDYLALHRPTPLYECAATPLPNHPTACRFAVQCASGGTPSIRVVLASAPLRTSSVDGRQDPHVHHAFFPERDPGAPADPGAPFLGAGTGYGRFRDRASVLGPGRCTTSGRVHHQGQRGSGSTGTLQFQTRISLTSGSHAQFNPPSSNDIQTLPSLFRQNHRNGEHAARCAVRSEVHFLDLP